MNNKLIIQLIKNNIEEIQNLINHFQVQENDLESGFPMLESRLASLNKDIEILKLNLSEKAVNSEKIQVSEIIQSVIETDTPIKPEIRPSELIEKEKSSDSQISNKTQTTEEKVPVQEQPKNEPVLSTLNDKLQASRGDNLQLKVPKSKLIDIQSAIGINDQFLFIRELFDNNSEEYKAAIAYINTHDDYDEILAHFNQEKQWDAEEPAVIQFSDIIKRKFE